MSPQCERVLTRLRHGGEIDAMTALNALGIFRLASRINELRKDGYPIQRRMKEVSNRWGETCHVAVYSLESGDEAI